MNEQFVDARRAAGTVSREIYMVGYETAEEVEALRSLVEEFKGTLDKSIVTPSNTVPLQFK